MSRTLFPNTKLIKRDVTERFLLAFREIFTHHETYTYADDDYTTGILIYPSYADLDTPDKKPKLILKAGGYNFNLADTLMSNLADEVTNEDGVVIGTTHKKVVNMNFSIIVQAYAEEESSDLADEVALMLHFSTPEVFAGYGITVLNSQIGETDLMKREDSIYQTVLFASITFPWLGIKTKTTLDTVDDAYPEIELPEGITSSLNRIPGIEVYKRKIAESSIMSLENP